MSATGDCLPTTLRFTGFTTNVRAAISTPPSSTVSQTRSGSVSPAPPAAHTVKQTVLATEQLRATSTSPLSPMSPFEEARRAHWQMHVHRPEVARDCPPVLLRHVLETLPEAAVREWRGHFAKCDIAISDTLALEDAHQALGAAERLRMRAYLTEQVRKRSSGAWPSPPYPASDALVITEAHWMAAQHRALQAKSIMPPQGQQMLCGWSSLLDAKFAMTPKALNALAAAACADMVALKNVTSETAQACLAKMIADGPDPHGIPGNHAIVWSKPKSAMEIVASLAIWLQKSPGKSLTLGLTQELGQWVQRVIAAPNAAIAQSYAMGGAGAFIANAAATVCQFKGEIYFYVPDRVNVNADEPAAMLPRDIIDRFHDNVVLTHSRGFLMRPSAVSNPTLHARINSVAEYAKGNRFTLDAVPDYVANPRADGRIILNTPSIQSAPFHPSCDPESGDARVMFALRYQKIFLAGLHYLTTDEAVDTGQIATLAADLRALGKNNPHQLKHFEYVEPKGSRECELINALKADRVTGQPCAIDSIAFNATELDGFVRRNFPEHVLRDLPNADADVEKRNVALETPHVILHCMDVISREMGVDRIQVHGYYGDYKFVQNPPGAGSLLPPGGWPTDGVLTAKTQTFADQFILAMMRARQLGAMKAANPTGEIVDRRRDIWDILPTVDGEGMAHMRDFATTAAHLDDADPRSKGVNHTQVAQHILTSWTYQRPNGTLVMFAPTRGFHAEKLALVGMGDMLDGMTFLHEPNVPKFSV